MKAVTTSGVSVIDAGTGQADASIVRGSGVARASEAWGVVVPRIEIGARGTQGVFPSDAYRLIFSYVVAGKTGSWGDFGCMRRCCAAMYALGARIFNARFQDTRALCRELEYCSDNGYFERGKEFILLLNALGILEGRKRDIAERLLLPFTGYDAVEVDVCRSREKFILGLVNAGSPLFKKLDLDLLRVLSMKLECSCNIQKDFASIFLQTWEDKYCGDVLVADRIGCVHTWPRWIPVYSKMDPCDNASVSLVLQEMEMANIWSPEGIFEHPDKKTIKITKRVLLDIVTEEACPASSMSLLRKLLKEYGKHCRFTEEECLMVVDYLKKCEYITMEARMQLMFYYGRGKPRVIEVLRPELLELIRGYSEGDNLVERDGILTGITIGLIIRAIEYEEAAKVVATKAEPCLTHVNENLRLKMLDVLHAVYHIRQKPKKAIERLIGPTLVGLCQSEEVRTRKKAYETLMCWNRHIEFSDDTIRPMIAALGNDIRNVPGTIVSTALRCYGAMIENGVIWGTHYNFVKQIQPRLGEIVESPPFTTKLQAIWLLGILIEKGILTPNGVNIVTLDTLIFYKDILTKDDGIKHIKNESLIIFLRKWMQLEKVCQSTDMEQLWKEIAELYMEETIARGLVQPSNETDRD